MDTEFVACEAKRQAASQELEACLLEFVTKHEPTDLPESVLPSLAAATFSDGAAFFSAEDDGRLRILGTYSLEKVALSVESVNSPFWKQCKDGNSVKWSHMNEEESRVNGARIPKGGSIILLPACSLVSCLRQRAVCVWRSNAGGQLFSLDSYQVWDMEALKRAVNLIILTTEASRSVALRSRASAISQSLTSISNILKPQLVVLTQMTGDLAEPNRAKMSAQIGTLQEQLREMERGLM